MACHIPCLKIFVALQKHSRYRMYKQPKLISVAVPILVMVSFMMIVASSVTSVSAIVANPPVAPTSCSPDVTRDGISDGLMAVCH